ncbi:hypothetical protein OHA37_22590 [Streptomyces sp. NBC_00335]|uniref:hypothetical protein n=1 Tax=unclassified Streptomyces TaxID=2593676 RepID=UPI0022557D8E|nr:MULTISPECIES: hypothetical protein [unclassified Streptomyces]MCX5406650.1 hypothetical protein [Streptomyces sp. NBC_00086]
MNDQQQPPQPAGLPRRRRWVVGVAAGSVLLSGVGVAVAQVIKSPAQAAADSAAPPPSVLTAPVEQRVLVASVVVRGTVTAQQSVDVTPVGAAPGAAGAVVTKLPVAVGGRVEEGQVLLEVSGRPVIALRGTLPAYRDLKPGSEGGDVAQLQQALARLGHATGADRAGRFGEGTKAALSALYASAGYDPLPALPDGNASVVDARNAVTSAERAVEDARDAADRAAKAASAPPPAAPPAPSASPSAPAGARGTDRRAADGKGSDVAPDPGAEADVSALRKQVARAKEDLSAARAQLVQILAAVGPMAPVAEVVFLSSFPARVDSVASKVGAQVSGKVLTVSAGALVVNGYLQEYQKGLVQPGRQVGIASEVTGVTAVASVASVADTLGQEQPATGTGQPSGQQPAGPKGYLMVVQPKAPLDPRLAGQDVRLTIEAASTGGEVLVVPVSAVSAAVDGRTYVTVLEADGVRRRVRVTTGTTGDGHVEVRPAEGDRLAEGDRAVVGVRSGPNGSPDGAQGGPEKGK